MSEPDEPRNSDAPQVRQELEETRLPLAGRDWTLLHTGLILTPGDEMHFLDNFLGLLPYGVALWPSAVALAHEIGARAEQFTGTTVLELGAGVGLPGLVAASLGAHVAQTDNQDVALSVCRLNAARNGIDGIDHRLVDWTDWHDAAQYDWIIGSDIVYGDPLHPHLADIFETNLAPGGHILLSDPIREPSKRMFDRLAGQGWDITVDFVEIGEGDALRRIGVFDMRRGP